MTTEPTPSPLKMTRIYRVKEAMTAAGFRKLREIGLDAKAGEWVSWWTDGDVTLILQEYPDGQGLEVYGPLTTSNSLDDLLAAIAKQ